MERESGSQVRHGVLRDIYDAANRGDFDALLAHLHPEVVWVTPTDDSRGETR